jgi:hypothetical protein
MNNHEKQHHDDLLDRATDALRESPVPAGPPNELVAHVVASLQSHEMTAKPQPQSLWTRINAMKPITRIAVVASLSLSAALVVLCMVAVFNWPSAEGDQKVAKVPTPLVKDHTPVQFDLDGVGKQLESSAAKPAIPAVPKDIHRDLQDDHTDGQRVAAKKPDIPRPSLKMTERMFRDPTFSEGLAAFEGPLAQGAAPVAKGCNAALGYIDASGQYVIPPRFLRAEDFKHGIARVRDTDKQPYYYINHYGQRVPEAFVVEDPEPILKVARRDHKCGYVDTRTGKFVIEPAYDDAYLFHDGLALVVKDQKRGYIDTTGKVVIPIKYRAARHFSEGLAPVRLSVEEAKATGTLWAETGWTPWGYIDRTGKLVLPARFSNAEQFSEGLAYVSEYYMTPEGFRGFINHKGKHVLDMRDISDIKPIAPHKMPIPKDF